MTTVQALQLMAATPRRRFSVGADVLPSSDMPRIDVFPVASSGKPNFGDTFNAPRVTPSGTRKHEGIDIFATEGTPVFAVVDGNVRFATNKLGGNVAHLTSADGTWYYYAHLSAYEPAEGGQRAVRAGDVIGYVGHTGNAVNTPSHLHFEAHPGNGVAVNPFEALKLVAPDGSFHKDSPTSPPSPPLHTLPPIAKGSSEGGFALAFGLGTAIVIGIGLSRRTS